MSATKTQVSELHKLLCETLAAEIRNDPTPGILSVARGFLKDCNVQVDSDNVPKTVEDLNQAFDEHFVEGMPNFEN